MVTRHERELERAEVAKRIRERHERRGTAGAFQSLALAAGGVL